MAYLERLTKRALRASIQPDGKLRLEPDWLITDDIRRLVGEHRDELVREIMASSAVADSSREIAPDYHLLMVATNLDSWEADDPRFGYEVMLDVCYRQLDAAYYAWLRHRMENARNAHDAGCLDDAAFNSIRERFNTIHTWAVQHIGEDALRRALRTTNVKSYVGPSEHTFAAYRKSWDAAWNEYQRRQAARSPPEQSDQAAMLEHMLAARGYAGIRSSIIGDIVVLVRDDSVAVPAMWADKARFTMDELSLMIGSAPGMVKQIHEVKRTFGGKVVPTYESESRLFTGETPITRGRQSKQLSLASAG
ncbi:MAG: hypothetical protein M1335_07475 [Chloroflexi bacterium]|nr:hypothetical protein [Chloroflexota bacterium]